MKKDRKRNSRHAVTGGTCAGKSTGLARLREKLPEYGVTCLVVPEVATFISNQGLSITDMARSQKTWNQFQTTVLATQIALEDTSDQFLTLMPGTKKLLLCDRGCMDPSAYMSWRAFRQSARRLGHSLTDLRDQRYDAVHHMVTAADGAEAFYNFDNPVRTEPPEKARFLDQRILAAWNGHEHLRVIANQRLGPHGMASVSFEEKVHWLLEEVCHQIGIPAPREIERKFLVQWPVPLRTFPIPVAPVDIQQTYLRSPHPGVNRRIRCRTVPNDIQHSAVYVYTEKRRTGSARVRIEKERLIDKREYETFLEDRKRSAETVIKRRHSFVWNGQYFQLDILSAPLKIALLEVELTNEHQLLDLPPFVSVIREVTEDKRYSNHSIARGQCPGYTK